MRAGLREAGAEQADGGSQLGPSESPSTGGPSGQCPPQNYQRSPFLMKSGHFAKGQLLRGALDGRVCMRPLRGAPLVCKAARFGGSWFRCWS